MNWFKSKPKVEVVEMKTETAKKVETAAPVAPVVVATTAPLDPVVALRTLDSEGNYADTRAAAEVLLKYIEARVHAAAARDFGGMKEREHATARAHWKKMGGQGTHTAHNCAGCGGTRICMVGHAGMPSDVLTEAPGETA